MVNGGYPGRGKDANCCVILAGVTVVLSSRASSKTKQAALSRARHQAGKMFSSLS